MLKVAEKAFFSSSLIFILREQWQQERIDFEQKHRLFEEEQKKLAERARQLNFEQHRLHVERSKFLEEKRRLAANHTIQAVSGPFIESTE
jgi:hypothetical protein